MSRKPMPPKDHPFYRKWPVGTLIQWREDGSKSPEESKWRDATIVEHVDTHGTVPTLVIDIVRLGKMMIYGEGHVWAIRRSPTP